MRTHCAHLLRLQAVIYPLDTIRTRLAVSPVGTYRGVWHTAAKICREDGARSLYRGLTPSMVSEGGRSAALEATVCRYSLFCSYAMVAMVKAVACSAPLYWPSTCYIFQITTAVSYSGSQIGILPFAGVDIMIFEMLKDHLLEAYEDDPPPLSILAAGMLSSCVAQLSSYPLAVVRTRLQVRQATGQGTAADRHRGT